MNVGGGRALKLLTELPELAIPMPLAGGGDGWGNILAKAFKGVSVFGSFLFSEALVASLRSVRVLSQASCCGAEDSSLSGIRAFSVALLLAS